MASKNLAQIWSLNTDPNPPRALPSLDLALLNALLVNRWGARLTSSMLSVIPPSETRLRDEGLCLLYEYFRTLVDGLGQMVQKQGISVPQFKDVPEDWREESTDNKTVKEDLMPHMVEPVRKYVEFLDKAFVERNYHWSTITAIIPALAGVYLDSLAATKDSVNLTQAKIPETHLEIPTSDMAQTQEKLQAALGVIEEEILRVRNEPDKTGWREEEAKAFSTECMRNLRELYLGHIMY